jgi:hypothetical protein
MTRPSMRLIFKLRGPSDKPEDGLTPEEEKVIARGFRQLRRGNYVTWDQLRDELGLKTIKLKRPKKNKVQ